MHAVVTLCSSLGILQFQKISLHTGMVKKSKVEKYVYVLYHFLWVPFVCNCKYQRGFHEIMGPTPCREVYTLIRIIDHIQTFEDL